MHVKYLVYFYTHQFSHSVVSDSLRPNEPQHARPPCPSPTPRVHPNPHPSSWRCHPTISSSVIPFSSCPQSFPASGSFQMSQLFVDLTPKYWSFSFSISPSHEHSGLISFRMDWLDLLAVQEVAKSQTRLSDWTNYGWGNLSAVVWDSCRDGAGPGANFINLIFPACLTRELTRGFPGL